MADKNDFFVAAKQQILSVLDTSLAGQMDSFSNTVYTFGRYGVSIYVLWYAYRVLAKSRRG